MYNNGLTGSKDLSFNAYINAKCGLPVIGPDYKVRFRIMFTVLYCTTRTIVISIYKKKKRDEEYFQILNTYRIIIIRQRFNKKRLNIGYYFKSHPG